MKRHLGTAAVGLVCFVLGVAAERVYELRSARSQSRAEATAAPAARPAEPAEPAANATPIAFDREPLWAYGYTAPPRPGDRAEPQSPPTHALRPDQPPEVQTHPGASSAARPPSRSSTSATARTSSTGFPPTIRRCRTSSRTARSRLGPLARGCASCHLPTGQGRPENAPPAGLPAAYFLRQIHDFRHGLRRTRRPAQAEHADDDRTGAGMTDDEIKAAARLLQRPQVAPWIRVVETDLVPKTRISGNLFLPLERDAHRADRWPHHRSARGRGADRDATATRTPASSPTCRSAASGRARIS